MTTKTIAFAVAATFGLVASADVFDVKFTVKTMNQETTKLESKVISGLIDTAAEQYVFWSKVKVPETNANGKVSWVKKNIPYENTYFGLVNDTTATKAKKVGQNAELIWGDEENPENVLVAGAWGSSSSKSGQVAGMIDNIPANGTWSAKYNKKTYAELLVKYGVEQTENTRDSVINGLDKSIEDLENDIVKAKEEAEAAIKAAEKEGEAAVAAAEAEAEKKIAAAEEAYNKALAEKKAEYEKAIAEEQAASKKAIAEKQDALDLANQELAELVGSLKNINDPDIPNMMSKYLEKTLADANALLEESTEKIEAAENAYTDYTNLLNTAALELAVDDATTNVEAKTLAVAVAQAVVDAWTVTNDMVAVIDANQLDEHYNDSISGLIALKKTEIAAKERELESAQGDFDSYTNELTKTYISYTNVLAIIEKQRDEAEDVMEDAKDDLDEAQTALDNFVVPTPETDENMLDFDEYVAVYGPYSTKLEAEEAWGAYKTEYIADAKQRYSDAVDAAQGDYDAAKLKYGEKVGSCNWYANESAKLKAKIEAAEESGEVPDSTKIAELKEELETLNAELNGLEADYEFWKSFEYSDNDKVAFAKALEDAKGAKEDADGELLAAQEELTEAETALEVIAPNNQNYALGQLGVAIGKDLTNLKGAENVPEVRKAVDDYLNTPLGGVEGKSLLECVELSNRSIAAVNNIKAEMGLE